jgi:hypothetical protein
MKTINPDSWITLTNKYSAKCHNCQEDIDVGEKILWKKGTGVKHTKCKKKEIYLETAMPEKKIKITDKEWEDFQKYSHDVLLKKNECQCCGKNLGKSNDTYINNDKRVCEKHFTT